MGFSALDTGKSRKGQVRWIRWLGHDCSIVFSQAPMSTSALSSCKKHNWSCLKFGRLFSIASFKRCMNQNNFLSWLYDLMGRPHNAPGHYNWTCRAFFSLSPLAASFGLIGLQFRRHNHIPMFPHHFWATYKHFFGHNMPVKHQTPAIFYVPDIFFDPASY